MLNQWHQDEQIPEGTGTHDALGHTNGLCVADMLCPGVEGRTGKVPAWQR